MINYIYKLYLCYHSETFARYSHRDRRWAEWTWEIHLCLHKLYRHWFVQQHMAGHRSITRSKYQICHKFLSLISILLSQLVLRLSGCCGLGMLVPAELNWAEFDARRASFHMCRLNVRLTSRSCTRKGATRLWSGIRDYSSRRRSLDRIDLLFLKSWQRWWVAARWALRRAVSPYFDCAKELRTHHYYTL